MESVEDDVDKPKNVASFSEANFLANQKFIQSDEPNSITYLQEVLEADLRVVKADLDARVGAVEHSKLDLIFRSSFEPFKQIRRCLREEWVLVGALSHNYNHAILEKIAANFEKIDCVPNGYLYPELYAPASNSSKCD